MAARPCSEAYFIWKKNYFFLEINCFQTTDLVERAHSQGLEVLVWTFRNEYEYLAWEFNQDPYQELDKFTYIGKTLRLYKDVILSKATIGVFLIDY